MRTLMKWVGYVVLVLLVIAAGAWVRGGFVIRRMAAKTFTVPDVRIAASVKAKASVARGRHLYESWGGCAECHADDLGGRLLYNDVIVGRFGGVNLTRRAKTRTDEQLMRSIRHGVKDDRTTNWMPSAAYFKMFTQEDLASLVKYIRSAPAVDRADVPLKWGVVMQVMMGLGQDFPLDPEKIGDHTRAWPQPVPEVQGAAFGKRIVMSLCVDCHKDDLTGGPIPGSPPGFAPAANLTQDALGDWTEEGFLKTVRTAVNPSGTRLREPMAGLTKYIGRCTDTELKSIWAYLKTVKGKTEL